MNPQPLPEQQSDYFDFEVTVIAVKSSSYRVSVRSAAGEGSATFRKPYKADQLEKQLLLVENAILRSGVPGRQALTPQSKQIRDFGKKLFDALLPDDLGGLFHTTKALAKEAGTGVRVRLNFEPADLAALPWEFLFDSRGGEFICLSAQTPIVRYLSLAKPIPLMEVAAPLRILGMVARPVDVDQITADHEKQRVEEALSDLTEQGIVELHWLEGQSRDDLQQELQRGAYHVFHYIGHGGFDPQKDEGFIVLANKHGRRSDCSASILATLLADEPSLRLVVLNSCQGATGGGKDTFSSTASIILQRGDVAAVVAMQYEISDPAAIIFAREMYRSIAAGVSIDVSVAEGRKALMGRGESVEWATPVLHLRSRNGLLFTPLVGEGGRTNTKSSAVVTGQSRESPLDKKHPWGFSLNHRFAAMLLGSLAAIVFLAGALIWILQNRNGPNDEQTPTVPTNSAIAAVMSDIRISDDRCVYAYAFCTTSGNKCSTTPVEDRPGVVVTFTVFDLQSPLEVPIPITYSVIDGTGQTVSRDEPGWPTDAVIPLHEGDQGVFDLWVPHQLEEGPHKVEVTLNSPHDGEVPIVSATTEPFSENYYSCN